MRLLNKVAVVTGGAKGIGGEISQIFANNGAKVIAVDMGDLEYQNENVEAYQLNITDVAGCEKFYQYVIEKYGRVDILVNNAGINGMQ